MSNTISFSEKNKGWTCFHEWSPGMFTRLKNRMFTIKNGQLYLHNDKENPVRDNFYGEQLTSRIKTVINDEPESDKVYKTLVTEGNSKWSANLSTNFAESTLAASEFQSKESREFAYLRQNEQEEDLHGLKVQGVGAVKTTQSLKVGFNKVPESVSIGDGLYQDNDGNSVLLGEINLIESNVLTLVDLINTPSLNSFCYAMKSSRIEGGEMRGYYLEVELESTGTGFAELFAIGTNAVKSGV